MTELANSSFYDLLPPNLRDAHARALSYASDRQFAKLAAHIVKTYIYANVMALDEKTCDFLALQHNVKAYEMTFPLQTKREMISIAFITSLKKGTTSAVKQVIATIHGGAEIHEWFDYGGDPHTFKVTIDSTKQNGIDDETYDKMLENIFEYKALRSHLEGITVNLKLRAGIHIGGAIVAGEHSVLKPRITDGRLGVRVVVGGAVVTGEMAAIRPRIRDPQTEAGLYAAGACVSGEVAAIRPHIPNLASRGGAFVGGAVVSGEHAVIKMTRSEA